MGKGSPEVIDVLNRGLTHELTAVNQYFIASKTAGDWGYHRLAKEYYDESIGEMRHAETLIDRILYLDGVPNMQRLNTVKVGESVIEQFQLNYELEQAAVALYQEGVKITTDHGDPGTRKIIEEILAEEEHHVDEAESELENLDQIGEQLWLAKWTGTED